MASLPRPIFSILRWRFFNPARRNGRARLGWRLAQTKHPITHARPLRAADREVMADIRRLHVALMLVAGVAVYGTLGFTLIKRGVVINTE